jgi:membrane-associated phospholipid phosphatase
MIGTSPVRRLVSGPSLLLGLSIVVAVPAAPVAAQDQPSSIQLDQPSSIKWWHGALAVGGISALMLLDGSVRHLSQDVRGHTGDGVASTVRHMGQPEVYGTITAGLLAAGLISGDSRVTQAGGRLAATMALTAAMAAAGKFVAGRPRPDAVLPLDGDDFLPFSGREAMPSGHTAMAFALATSLADDIKKPWATAGLYTLAGAVAWSRINDNRHWFSDVAAGALVGITSAKLASGRWKIFGITAPSILATPRGLGLGWQAEF